MERRKLVFIIWRVIEMNKNHKKINIFSIISVASSTFLTGYGYLTSKKLICAVACLVLFVILIIYIYVYIWKNDSTK